MKLEKNQDAIFKALSDSSRRMILDLLKDGPKTTGDICKSFKKLDRCTVMQHLGVLEKAGLVFTRKEGKFKWNYLDVGPIQGIYHRWINQYAAPSADLLFRLKNNLET